MAKHDNSVAESGDVRKSMEAGLDIAKALLGGTTAMREATTKYLPQEPKEKPEHYRNRLQRTVLFNAFKKTIGVLAGKVFKNGITYKDNISSQFQPWLENIDLEGNNISQFSYESFKNGLANGIEFILVDMPKPMQREDGKPLSLKEEQSQNIRPYFVSIDANSLIGFSSEIINGVQTLTQVRISEFVEETVVDDEFATMKVNQIRVIDIGMVRIYRQNAKTQKWDIFDSWNTSFNFIPVVAFYADKLGFFHGVSPLLDLAHLNIDHWQKSSDLSNILHLVQVPVMWAAGIPPKTDITVGPNSFVAFENQDAKLGYLEPTGKGTELGMASLEQSKENMSVMGASMLIHKSGTQTATEKAINEGGSNSELAAVAKNFEDTLNTAFEMMAKMVNDSTSAIPIARLNTDFGVAGKGAITTDELLKIRVSGEISHETFINRLNELTGFNIDAKSEQDKLDNESPALINGFNPLDMGGNG